MNFRHIAQTNSFVAVFIVSVLCWSCSFYDRTPIQFGTYDEKTGKQIARINDLASLRKSHQYSEIAEHLTHDLKLFVADAYARSRINNELAEIYSSELLDIESAIALDESILSEPVPQDDTLGNFVPQNVVASQRIVADRKYFEEFVTTSAATISKRAEERLAANRLLLVGQRPGMRVKYDIGFLQTQVKAVLKDISSTQLGTPDRFRILSRLFKVEYEIKRLDKNFDLTAYQYIINNQLSVESIDLSEIDFLSLADYFSLVFKKTGDIRFAQFALDTVYRPYVNLRNPAARWQYNKIINDYITTLIDANYTLGRYDELLYYTSLNKSRMLLEERLAFSSVHGSTTKIADLTVNDEIERDQIGLPDKVWFKHHLATTGAYLDFYVGGKYVSKNVASTSRQKDRSSMPMTTRDFGVEDNADKIESFIDDAVYVIQVRNGSVASAKKLTGVQLTNVREQLDAAYHKVSDIRQGGTAQPVSFFRDLYRETGVPPNLSVSPDKWISKHPLDVHLDAKVTRSVNFFTTATSDRLDNLRVVGFFNPTMDLPGAEQEASVILDRLPETQVFQREAASVGVLSSTGNANVVHLSMHGAFNADDPKNSKLYFSGAHRGLDKNDHNALYARDMVNYPILRDRDLIFAAACQTGLSAADQVNENELMGILRPLTANRNKNIILSLWKVDDAATKDFVSAFYQRLASSKNVAESFHFAQDEVRNKYKQPFYWAAFYLSQSR